MNFQSGLNTPWADTTHPAYSVCEELQSAHVDFKYLATLCYLFVEEDYSSARLDRDLKNQLGLFRLTLQYGPSCLGWVKELGSRKLEEYRTDFEETYQREFLEREAKEMGSTQKPIQR